MHAVQFMGHATASAAAASSDTRKMLYSCRPCIPGTIHRGRGMDGVKLNYLVYKLCYLHSLLHAFVHSWVVGDAGVLVHMLVGCSVQRATNVKKHFG